jgi:tetratricopeptide (TPR) repeat protein
MRKTRMCLSVATLAVALFSLGCGSQISYLKARNALNKGVASFGRANYSFAVEHFKEAIAEDPSLLDARQYLATAYMSQYIPGSESEGDLELARNALQGFQDVLDHDPTEAQAILAISSMASLYFNMKEFDQSLEWYDKLLAMDPNNLPGLYTKGVIAWTQVYLPRLEVRAMLGMSPEDPGPIKADEAKTELAEMNMPIIEDGMKCLETAIELDPDYDDAMAYLNLLYRERADISETKEEYDEYTAQADNWVQQTLDTKKRKAEASTKELFQEGQ